MRTKEELEESLGEHIDWLRASAASFDAGVVSESKRIAVAIRTLVHDTSNSTSLLTQLGMRDRMPWVSVVPLEGKRFTRPLWIDDPRVPGFEAIHEVPMVVTTFDTWWRASVLSLSEEEVSRSWMVLHVANVDGGAHVGPVLPPHYESISRQGGLAPVRINSAGAPYPDTSNPIPSGIRTMCTEVLYSLKAV